MLKDETRFGEAASFPAVKTRPTCSPCLRGRIRLSVAEPLQLHRFASSPAKRPAEHSFWMLRLDTDRTASILSAFWAVSTAATR